MRYCEIDAERVRSLRVTLCLSQDELAARLGVTRRTIIRGEQRGLELPWRPDSPRAHVYKAWRELQEEALRSPLNSSIAKKSRDTLPAIVRKKSRSPTARRKR